MMSVKLKFSIYICIVSGETEDEKQRKNKLNKINTLQSIHAVNCVLEI